MSVVVPMPPKRDGTGRLLCRVVGHSWSFPVLVMGYGVHTCRRCRAEGRMRAYQG